MSLLRRIFSRTNGSDGKGRDANKPMPPIDFGEFRHRLVVSITPSAAEKLCKFREDEVPGSFVRVGVLLQGPTGFMYDFKFDTHADPQIDLVGESSGITVVIDSKFLPLLDGTIVEWRETPQGGGFYFTNPNAIDP